MQCGWADCRNKQSHFLPTFFRFCACKLLKWFKNDFRIDLSASDFRCSLCRERCRCLPALTPSPRWEMLITISAHFGRVCIYFIFTLRFTNAPRSDNGARIKIVYNSINGRNGLNCDFDALRYSFTREIDFTGQSFDANAFKSEWNSSLMWMRFRRANNLK